MMMEREATPATPRLDEPVILFVDDDPQIRTALRRCFRKEAYDLILAASAEEGLHWLSEFWIDAVVADQRLPGTLGTEFLHEVRRRFPRVPCALLTAFRTRRVLQEGERLGVTTIVYKPWEDDALRDTVRRLLQGRTGTVPSDGDEAR